MAKELGNTVQSARYQVKNGSQYNDSLVHRGDITLWLEESITDPWHHSNPERKRRRPGLAAVGSETFLRLDPTKNRWDDCVSRVRSCNRNVELSSDVRNDPCSLRKWDLPTHGTCRSAK